MNELDPTIQAGLLVNTQRIGSNRPNGPTNKKQNRALNFIKGPAQGGVIGGFVGGGQRGTS